jgi:hypothetical protein
MLAPLDADAVEVCFTPDGLPQDEDCDGFIDCEDPSCENAEGCG